MSGMRKWLCLFFGVAFAALALSANAATKTFIVAVPGSVTAATTSVDVVVTVTGNSNGNSFEIDWTSNPNFTVTGGIVKGTGQAGVLINPGQTSAAYKGIQFTFTGPVKTTTTVTLNVTVTPSCTATPVTWNAFMWTGGISQPSTSFTLQGGPYSTTLPALTHCSLSFSQQPANAFIGYTITSVPFNSGGTPPVTVHATSDSGSVAGVSVSVTATPACVIGGAAVNTNGSGDATFALSSAATATYPPLPPAPPQPGCVLTASAPGFGPAVTSNQFSVVLQNGVLTCDSSNNAAGNLKPLAPPPTGPTTPDWGLVRGLNNLSDCPTVNAVPFVFTLDQTPGHQVGSFIEDSLGQQTSVEYVIVWPPVNIDDDGWAGKQPCVSWGTGKADPTFTPDSTYGCTGDYEPALVCASTDVNAGSAVMPTIPNQPPYNLPTGIETQYQYGIDPATGVLRKAKVCVANFGANAYSPTQVQYWTKVIDQADSSIKFP